MDEESSVVQGSIFYIMGLSGNKHPHYIKPYGGCTHRDKVAAKRHRGGAKVCKPLMSE